MPLRDFLNNSPVVSAPRGAQGLRGLLGKPEAPPEEPSTLDKIISRVPKPIRTTVGTTLDVLGRPGAATAGAVDALVQGDNVLDRVKDNLTGTKRDNFDEVLGHAGVEDGLGRKAAGFIGDVVLDPLNLVGVGELKTAAKLAKLDHLAEAGAKLIPKGVRTFGTAVKDAVGDKFIPRYGMKLSEEDLARLNAIGRDIKSPEDAREALRMFQKERSTIPTRVEQDIVKRYKGTTPSFRQDVLEGMDAGAGKTPEIDAKVVEQSKLNNDLFNREVDAGVMKEGNYRPDYAPADYTRSKGPIKATMTNPQSALNARNRFARGRVDKEMTIGEHIAQGAEPDVALAQLTREISGNRAALTGEFIQDATKKFGIHVKDAPNDWQVLKNIPMESTLGKFTSDIAFPSYIAKQLDRVVAKPQESTILGKLYDQALKVWRTQATVLRPGFHATNFQGNMFNGAYLAGTLNPARFLEAATWDKVKNGAEAASQKIGKYTVPEVDEFMNRFGVGGAGHSFTSELMESGADKVLLEKLQGIPHPKNPITHPIRVAKAVGAGIEDFSKRALFFDQLHKGKSLEDAAKTVDKYLFDYQDLTEFERKWAKRVFPFYTWARKNIPLQVGELANQPGKYAAIGKAKNDIEQGNRERGTNTPEAFRPSFIQEAEAVQLPRKKGESAKYWSPYLPYQDLNKVPMPGGSTPLDAGRDLASGLEPIAKGVTELLTNKSLFFNKPLFDEQLGPIGDRQKVNALLDLLPEGLKKQLFTETIGPKGKPQFETPALVRYLASQLPLMEATGKAAQSIAQPENVSNPYSWLSPVAGVRVTERDNEQEIADRKGALSDARSLAKKQQKQNRKPAGSASKAKVDSLFDRYKSGS
jgi:hypothetical protein